MTLVGDSELSKSAAMFHQLTRDAAEATKNARSATTKITIDEARSTCTALEAFCSTPQGVEAIEALTKISARLAAGNDGEASSQRAPTTVS